MPRLRSILTLLGAFLLGAPAAIAVEQIVVTNYGVAANGVPYAVAMEKGFFKQEGADISGILSSDGGGSTVRVMLGGMDRMIQAQTMVGAFSGTVDWSKLVDTSFLPDDLKPYK